ncbi:MAG: LytTR family DNA-binding domain-containing protein, partial [Bacteroidota bacterium]
QTLADNLDEKDETLPELLNLQNEKGKVELVIKADALLYLKAEDNYVSVFYLMHGTIKKELIRTSLKKIAHQVPEKCLIRVHRSYMINPQKIIRIEPIKDTFKISLAGLEDGQIPVSATYKESLSAIRPEISF